MPHPSNGRGRPRAAAFSVPTATGDLAVNQLPQTLNWSKIAKLWMVTVWWVPGGQHEAFVDAVEDDIPGA